MDIKQDTTTIKVTKDFLKELNKLKVHPRETNLQALERLLKETK